MRWAAVWHHLITRYSRIITKQAEIIVEAASADEARQQIANDLEVDPGAYDDDLEPVEDSVGEMDGQDGEPA